jgi:CRP-like cAMP-binding protein
MNTLPLPIDAPTQADADTEADAGANERHCHQGERLHDAGEAGAAWRVVSGTVRLDALEGEGAAPAFAGLAIAGDIVGAETLLLGRCTFRATALTAAVLEPWPGAAPLQGAPLLRALTQADRRAATVAALRAGQATERVGRLIRLLLPPDCAGAFTRIQLPSLREMADITAMTFETVSRALTELRRQGMLEPEGERRGRGRKTCRCLVAETTAAA